MYDEKYVSPVKAIDLSVFGKIYIYVYIVYPYEFRYFTPTSDLRPGTRYKQSLIYVFYNQHVDLTNQRRAL